MSLTPSLKLFKNRALMLVLMSVTAMTACMCGPTYFFMTTTPNNYCSTYLNNSAYVGECIQTGAVNCHDRQLMAAGETFAVCMQAVVDSINAKYATPVPVQAQARIDCSPFRLTSPLDGMPNGMTTFYWDPLPNAQRYEITLADYHTGNFVASFSADGSMTNLVADVGMGAIGGLFNFVVTIHAYVDDRIVCSDVHDIAREAPAAPPSSSGGSAPVVPTATLDFGTPEF